MKNTFEILLPRSHPGAADLQKERIETLVNVSLKKRTKKRNSKYTFEVLSKRHGTAKRKNRNVSKRFIKKNKNKNKKNSKNTFARSAKESKSKR